MVVPRGLRKNHKAEPSMEAEVISTRASVGFTDLKSFRVLSA